MNLETRLEHLRECCKQERSNGQVMLRPYATFLLRGQVAKFGNPDDLVVTHDGWLTAFWGNRLMDIRENTGEGDD